MVSKFMNQLKEWWKVWLEKHALSPKAAWWLGAISFLESSILIFPIDFLLIAILLSPNSEKKWAYYAWITTLWSIIGGVFGYLIGFSAFQGFGETIISTYGLEKIFSVIGGWYQDNALLAVFSAGFVPLIPYKVFTISAGLFQIPFLIFISASVVSRGIRFFAVAFIMKRWGKELGVIILKHFNTASIVLFILILLYFIL